MDKYLKIYALVLLAFLISSCSTVDRVLALKKENKVPALGSLVVRKNFNQLPETKGTLEGLQRLRVRVEEKKFNSKIFDKYEAINGSDRIRVNYVDSISAKPTYFVIELIDDIAYVDLLKEDVNREEYAFAKANVKTRIVSEIAIALESKKLDASRAYFLELNKKGDRLIGYKNNGQDAFVLEMSEAFVFDFKLSYAAWGKDQYDRIELVDIIEEGRTCPSPLVRKPSKLEKDINLFNY